ncbi:Rho GTPase activation protein [Protomyces lactucae-debilis]|uniref:Rho GTPase activation protein n=1 Tax=Protomyces lactucae-debilis TaxID=2754530 RepID=A0A1Y2ER56_PROLT|nr:Rho GTPase activation protein [Protomyces lactucae-debilis]ORY73666.1 Rho GTPase activation protein [Protomyces lactucae-debilis]
MTTAASRDLPHQHQPQQEHAKEGLSSWWARFKSKPSKKEEQPSKGIFGVPLHQSIQYANVAISLYNDQGQPFIYGHIPVVVAKCGLFLKEHATEVEGIFRLSGSAKRIKELQEVFDLPPKYGKQHEWNTYTVHDAANVLRRYLNHLPDPIIPTDWYDSVREPIRNDWPLERAIPRMQELVSSLPPVNRQLLLYILDLLAVFASKAEMNRMTSENLSAIFQPGVLSHPRDDMAPQEYHLSQKVLVFLIDNQAHFLLDMCPPTGPAQQATGTDVAGSPKRAAGLLRRKTLNTPRRSFSLRSPKSADGTQGGANLPASFAKSSSPLPPASGAVSRSNTLPTKRQAPGQQQRAQDGPRHASLPSLRHDNSSTMPTAGSSATAPVQASIPEMPEGSPATQAVPVPVPTNAMHRSSPGSSRTSLRLLDESNRHTVLAPSQVAGEGRRSRRSSQTSSLRGDNEFSILGGRKLRSDISAESVTGGSGELSSSIPAAMSSTSEIQAVPTSTSVGRASQRSAEPPMTSSSHSAAAGTKPSSSPGKFSNFFKRRTRMGKDEMLSPSSETGSAPGRRDLDD